MLLNLLVQEPYVCSRIDFRYAKEQVLTFKVPAIRADELSYFVRQTGVPESEATII